MYLSDREIKEAIRSGRLIVDPLVEIGPTSIDLHLDSANEAKIWDIDALRQHNKQHGHGETELRISKINYGVISKTYLKSPPRQADAKDCEKVIRRDNQIIMRPQGFVLWQTKEKVGTPEESPEFICFIDGKSTRARTGLVVHLTAPTIHAGWHGKVTLELANFGPFDIVLEEGDAVAQIVVAKISSVPMLSMKSAGSVTQGQTEVTGLKH